MIAQRVKKLILVGSLALIAAGCQQQDRASSAPDAEPAAAPEAPAKPMADTYVEVPDTTGAAMWSYLQTQNYQGAWSLWPGRGELYEGQEPHGMLLTTYLNDVAEAAVKNKSGVMPVGSIVVKENYMPDKTLAAITVMYKVPGYNRDHNDWFFTKHLPDGTLEKMPNGVSMEGKVPACQACHSAKRDNDYLFTGAISTSSGE